MLALCTLSLQLPGYKLAFNDRKSSVGVCMCVCVSGSLTRRLLFDQFYDAMKSTTLKSFCLTTGLQKAHP